MKIGLALVDVGVSCSVAHRRGRTIGGASKPSLAVMRRSTVTTSEITRFFSKPCPVISNLSRARRAGRGITTPHGVRPLC